MPSGMMQVLPEGQVQAPRSQSEAGGAWLDSHSDEQSPKAVA